MANRRLPAAIRIAALAAAAVALRLVIGRSVEIAGIPAISFVSGLLLAFALTRGAWDTLGGCAGIAVGSLLRGYSPLASVVTGASLGLAIEIMRRLLRGPLRLDVRLERVRDVAALFAAGVLGSLAGAAAIALAAFLTHYVPGPHQGSDWVGTFLSQLLGVLLGTPVMLAFLARESPENRNARVGETLPVAAVAVTIAFAVFLTPALPYLDATVLGLVALPLIAWVTLRGGRRLAMVLIALCVTIAMAGSARALGVMHGVADARVLRGMQSIAGGAVVFTLLLSANETSRRRALRTLRRREARLRYVLAGTTDGFWELLGTEATGPERTLLGRRIADILGLERSRLPATIAEYQALVHPDDLSGLLATMNEHFAGHTPQYQAEYRVRHADGHYIWVLSRGRVYRRGASGQPIRAAGTLTDITERKQAELGLRAARKLFDDFMRHSPAAAMIRDASGRILYANPTHERMFGLGSAELEGRLWQDVVGPESARKYMASDAEVARTGLPNVTEVHLDSPAGGSDWLSVKFLIKGAAGETLFGIEAVEITDRKRAEHERRVLEERMAVSQRLESLGLLAGGIAHDFNNILASILGHADLARSSLPEGSTSRAHVEEVAGAARRAAELTHRMLAYAGHAGGQARPLSLADLARENAALFDGEARGIELTEEIEPGLPAVRGDAAQLRQAVANLVTNASEAIGDGPGTIRLRVYSRAFARDELVSRWLADEPRPGRYVVLEIADSGSGMDEATLARIFDPFFSTKFTGRGLGMAAVLGIVRGHGGTVQVDSQPGQGAVARLLLPALAEPRSAAEPAPAPTRGGAALVIDDERMVGELAVTLMGRLGFSPVFVATGGQAGIERFREHADEIRVVLLDLTMPDMPGEEVRAAIRAIRPGACVVYSSGYGEREGSLDAPFVPKPWRLRDLADVIDRALERPVA